MQHTEPHTARYHDHRYRRIWRWSLLASLLFHVLFLFLFRDARPIPPSPFAAAGPRAGDARAAPGGGTEVIAVRIEPQVQPQPVQVEPVMVPVPAIEPQPQIVVEDPKPAIAPVPVRVEGTGRIGEGRGAQAGVGLEGGTGRGDGGNAEEGLFRLVPPSPRGLILPPSDRPGKVRGKEIDVWVFVNAAGRVLADSTRLDPTSTGDRGFDDRLKKQAAEWVFEPARKGGQPVAEWFRYTIIL